MTASLRITSYNVCYTKLLRVLVRGEIPNVERPRTVDLKQIGIPAFFPINGSVPWRNATNSYNFV